MLVLFGCFMMIYLVVLNFLFISFHLFQECVDCAVGCVLVVFGCVGCFGSFVFILCCEVEVSAGLGEFVFLFQVLQFSRVVQLVQSV